MKTTTVLCSLALFVPLALVGCNESTTSKQTVKVFQQSAPCQAGLSSDEEAEITDFLAKLSPEDRKLAEEQKFCPIKDDDRLGSRGVPIRLVIKDQPVFLCCGGCKKEALKEPDKTLAKVQELKAKNVASVKK